MLNRRLVRDLNGLLSHFRHDRCTQVGLKDEARVVFGLALERLKCGQLRLEGFQARKNGNLEIKGWDWHRHKVKDCICDRWFNTVKKLFEFVTKQEMAVVVKELCVNPFLRF